MSRLCVAYASPMRRLCVAYASPMRRARASMEHPVLALNSVGTYRIVELKSMVLATLAVISVSPVFRLTSLRTDPS